MKWRKIGKIFDPSEFSLPFSCSEFAQSPQTLVFEDFVRIYFSTRSKEPESGKFLSHIVYVDFDVNFQKILDISNKTVIELGELGTFDEHGIFPINPLKVDNMVYAYTCGWSRRVSVSVETSIGLAISDNNGISFKKLCNGPILSSSVNEPFLVGDAFVRKFEGIFHMWYIFGVKWIENNIEETARVYKVAHALSNDGINWERNGIPIISDKLNQNECQALPTVEFYQGKYHMFFCYREAIGFRSDISKGYRIGYAYSTNLKDWIRADDQIEFINTSGDWDSEMQCYPHLFLNSNSLMMLYNGNNFGRHGFGLAVCED